MTAATLRIALGRHRRRVLPERGCRLLVRLLQSLLMGLPLLALAAEEPPLKAAIVYNLLQYVQWPDEAGMAAGAPLVLCAERQGALWPHLFALNGRAVRQMRLELREPADEDAIRGCRAWLLEDGSRALPPRTPTGLLTIADGSRAERGGVVISLHRGAASRLSFDVDLGAARHQGLQLSSKMLRLARQVRE
jgi:hypothetical protein